MFRFSPKSHKAACMIALLISVYLCAYIPVRISHTKYWFDKSTEETGSYTFFDTWSKADTTLYWVFYPMLVIDSIILGRPFVQDKW
jgi:hypothetical protein